MPRFYTPQERRGFSLARVLSGMNSEAGLNGCLEAEILADQARDLGEGYDAHRIHLPLQLLTRDMSVGLAANSGAQLAGTDTAEPFHAIRQFSLAARLGAQIMTGLVGNVDIPKITTTTGGGWQDGENDALGEETPTTSKVSLTPKIAGTYIQYTRRLKLQTQIDAILARHMLIQLGNLIDQAVIDGTGLAGQPTGLMNSSGVGDVSGTSFAWDDALAMEASAATAAGDLPLAFVGHPDSRQLLGGRAKGSGDGFIWADRRIGDVDAFASAAAPSKSLLVGPWGTVIIAMWGESIVLEVNPYENFQTGLLGARMLASVDIGLPGVTMFAKSESLT